MVPNVPPLSSNTSPHKNSLMSRPCVESQSPSVWFSSARRQEDDRPHLVLEAQPPSFFQAEFIGLCLRHMAAPQWDREHSSEREGG